MMTGTRGFSPLALYSSSHSTPSGTVASFSTIAGKGLIAPATITTVIFVRSRFISLETYPHPAGGATLNSNLFFFVTRWKIRISVKLSLIAIF
jgi:hypothetical protein